MAEESKTTANNSNFQSDILPPDNYLDENFFSAQIRPENIFCEQPKDTSEVQLSSKILNFPFTLKYYELIHLKDESDPELNYSFCNLILGDFKKVRYSESLLKMIFFSKDQRTPLNLMNYINEIQSLKNITGIEFICICKNKIFIQYENENTTKDNFTSLQKSYSVLDLLYDEDYGNNFTSEEQKKENNDNNLLSSEKKFNDDFKYIEQLLSSEKKGKKLDFNDESEIKNEPNKICNKEGDLKYNLSESDSFQNTEKNDNIKNTINLPNDPNKLINNQKQQTIPNNLIPPLLNPQLYPQFLLQKNNNTQKIINPQINPLLFLQLSKINPLVLQTALFMQNMFKMQQMSQKSTEIKNGTLNNNINFNGKNNKINYETEKNPLPNNFIDFSTKSNTSSTTSSKESSPATNYQEKTNFNNINNMNIPSINFGLFNGFNNNNNNNNNNNQFQNLYINNNKLNNYKDSLNDLLNLSKSDNNKNNKSDSSQKSEDLKDNSNNISITNNINDNNYNLDQIIIDNKYKEFIPKKDNKNNNIGQTRKNHHKNNNIINSPNSEKGLQFHTNSTRDYQYKYVSRYIVQIENDKNFPVTRMIIGNSGKLLRDIIVENCIKYDDYTTKIRLRGKGSGYKEGPKNEESNDPMELCISSLNMFSYIRCSNEIENLLKKVYYQYYLYQINNKDKNNEEPIVMKKILKYPYVVNRFNTLVKEEKRRKKEEELKQVNQGNNNNEYDNNNNDNDNEHFNNNK